VNIRVRRELLDQSGVRGKQVMWSARSNEMLPFGGASVFDCRSSPENCQLRSWRHRWEMDRLSRGLESEIHTRDCFAHRVQVGCNTSRYVRKAEFHWRKFAVPVSFTSVSLGMAERYSVEKRQEARRIRAEIH
jgi:hypothetical protein